MTKHLVNKFLHAHQKRHVTLRDGTAWPDQPAGWSHCTTSQMLLWSFWNARAKSVIKVFLYNCLPGLLHDCIPKQQASTSKSNDQIYCGPYRDKGYSPYYVKCFECLEKRYINVTNHYYYCVYLVTSPVSVYQEVTILLSLTHQMEMCLFTNVFCDIQIFAHKLNSQL